MKKSTKPHQPDHEIEHSATESPEIEFLIRHYPWFSRQELIQALNSFGRNSTKVMAYLHFKSGGYNFDDSFEF